MFSAKCNRWELNQIISLLRAFCLHVVSHAGLVDLGRKCFNSLSQYYGITHRMEHYACMVDILGRAGNIDEAQNFIKMMPIEPDSSVWNALLASWKIRCYIELGEWASK